MQPEERETHFSDTAASRSAMLLSILKRSLRAKEKDLAIVLRTIIRLCHNLGNACRNLRLRSIRGLPVAVKLFVGHFEGVEIGE